jgi:rRNA-processing protein FCF1
MTAESAQKKNALKIILDSNAFFVPLQFKIDVFEGLKTLLKANFEPILLSPILKELEKLARDSSPKMRKEAYYALKMAQRCTLINMDENLTDRPDDAIINVAQERKYPVFTNDRQLKKRLRNINVPVIYVRQKTRLEIDGRI